MVDSASGTPIISPSSILFPAGRTTPLSDTPIVLSGPFRMPAQLLAEQTYDGHKSLHDDEAAARLGLRGAPIEGPTHFSQFEPLGAALWGDRWFTHGCISSHFLNMVIDGEEVQAQMTLPGPGVSSARIDACKRDGTPVLTGTASVDFGSGHGETDLSARLAKTLSREVGEVFIIDQLAVGQRGARESAPGGDVVTMGFDDHMGDLYPFTLQRKLDTITERMSYFERDAVTPWGGPIVPMEMLSVLTGSTSHLSGFRVRQPSVGLFIDLEVRVLDGPVFVGRPYRLEREIVALSQSKRTESYWTRTTLFDAELAVAEVLLHSGVFKESYQPPS
jgi:hypothetical protein